jgi:hypothetical protein
MRTRVGAAYRSVASELSAGIAPVGLAWHTALRDDPRLRLYRPDGSHPSWTGTYLTALVLYGSITGGNPATPTYRPPLVRRRHARALRNAARSALDLQRATDLPILRITPAPGAPPLLPLRGP